MQFCEINNIYLYLKLSSSLPTLTEIYLIAPCPRKAYVWGCREGFYSPSHTHINFFRNLFILFSFSFIIESYRPSPQKNRHKAWQIISGDSWSFLFSCIWHDPLETYLLLQALSSPFLLFFVLASPVSPSQALSPAPGFTVVGSPLNTSVDMILFSHSPKQMHHCVVLIRRNQESENQPELCSPYHLPQRKELIFPV